MDNAYRTLTYCKGRPRSCFKHYARRPVAVCTGYCPVPWSADSCVTYTVSRRRVTSEKRVGIKVAKNIGAQTNVIHISTHPRSSRIVFQIFLVVILHHLHRPRPAHGRDRRGSWRGSRWNWRWQRRQRGRTLAQKVLACPQRLEC